MIRLLLPLAPLAALAACGEGEAPPPAPAPSPSGATAQVAALPAGQRNGVLFRAIQDAGRQSCQRVDASEPAGGGAWIATCTGGERWLVTIGADGAATVTGRADPAAARP